MRGIILTGYIGKSPGFATGDRHQTHHPSYSQAHLHVPPPTRAYLSDDEYRIQMHPKIVTQLTLSWIFTPLSLAGKMQKALQPSRPRYPAPLSQLSATESSSVSAPLSLLRSSRRQKRGSPDVGRARSRSRERTAVTACPQHARSQLNCVHFLPALVLLLLMQTAAAMLYTF